MYSLKTLKIISGNNIGELFIFISYFLFQNLIGVTYNCNLSLVTYNCDGRVTYDGVLKIVNTLDTAKASQQSDIPTKILKQNSDYFAQYFYENINQCISKSISPSDLKLADVTPVYKKKSKNSKGNYRPVSISNISKLYEGCIYDQIQLFFDSLLSKYQCGFRRGYNAQHCLITLIEKWKKSVGNGGAFGALFTELSKAFDCLPHELLIAKLDAYGLGKKS